jgi:hypothetical protein
MDGINKIINKELHNYRKSYLIESIKPLNKIKDKEKFYENYILTIIKLLNEGYDLNEIEIIEEQENVQTQNQGDISQTKSVVSGLFGAGKSIIKERIIMWIVTSFGIKGALANAIATAFADYNVLRLLRLFKSKETCIAELRTQPGLPDAIIEAIIGYLQSGNETTTWKGNKSGIVIRNILGELIRSSNLGEQISNQIVKLIWKE